MIWLFNLDETLIDKSIYVKMNPEIIANLKTVVGDVEVEKNIASLKEKYGHVDIYYLSQKLEQLDLYYDILLKYVTLSKMKFNGKEVIDRLKENKQKIVLITNAHRRTIEMFLAKYDLLFDVIYTKENATDEKSDDRYWNDLISRLAIDVSDSTIVSDNLSEDIMIGKKMGFKTIHIGTDIDNLGDLEI